MQVIGWLAARRRSVDDRVWDALVAVGLLAVLANELGSRVPLPGQRASSALAYALAGLMSVPYAVHRRHPVPAAIVCLGAVLGYSAGQYVAFPGYPVFVLVFGVALHTGRRAGVLTAAGAVVALTVAIAVQPVGVAGRGAWISTVLATALAWALGENLRLRRARWAALEERARRLETEREDRARQAVFEERLRIARDLHDVIAHSMSVIAVQAGVAHHVLDSRPELARQTLASVEGASRAALVEMRRLMGVLRQDEQQAGSLAPAPGLDDVPGLVAQLADAGLPVVVRRTGAVRAVPAGVGLSGYRIVQEGLTNVLRHGGPRAEVTVGYEAATLTLRVVDPGRTLPDRTLPDRSVSDQAGSGRTGPRDGNGHGLIGMRERVALFGGTLQAGPLPGGGFVVHAEIPLPGTAPPETAPPETAAAEPLSAAVPDPMAADLAPAAGGPDLAARGPDLAARGPDRMPRAPDSMGDESAAGDPMAATRLTGGAR